MGKFGAGSFHLGRRRGPSEAAQFNAARNTADNNQKQKNELNLIVTIRADVNCGGL